MGSMLPDAGRDVNGGKFRTQPLPRAGFGFAGGGALLLAKQLARQQPRRQGAAGDDQQPLVAPPRLFVDQVRQVLRSYRLGK